MFYDFDVTVPADTPAGEPLVQELSLSLGVIHRVEILFPAGCHGMVHAVLEREGTQFLPTNQDGSFAADAETVSIDEFKDMSAEPFSLVFVGWSPGTLYNHTLHARIGVLLPEQLQPNSGLMGALTKFMKLVGIGS